MYHYDTQSQYETLLSDNKEYEMADNKVKIDLGKFITPDNKAKQDDDREKLKTLSKEVLEERYVASSAEGKKLAARLREIENELVKKDELLTRFTPYQSIFDRLNSDEGAVKVLKDYISGKPAKSDNGDDDFGDEKKPTESFDPNSDSGKQMRQFVLETIGQAFNTYDQKNAKRTSLERQEEELLRNNPSMTKEKLDHIVKSMANKEMTLEDLVLLHGKDAIFQTLSEQYAKADAKQVQNVSQFPDFAGGIKSGKEKVEPGEALLAFAEEIEAQSDPMSQIKTTQV